MSLRAGPAVKQQTELQSGYQSREYAHAFSEFGTPVQLAQCGGWLIERPVPGAEDDRDAMGCYPLFSCLDWKSLKFDLEALEQAQRVVAVSLVADPFADVEHGELEACFDFVRPFKEHFLVDLQEAPDTFITRHHRYYARRSLRGAVVEVSSAPADHLDEWVALYDVLIDRHDLRGIKAFSRASFAQQLQTPGMLLIRMTVKGIPLGMQLWFVQGNVAYSHLTAVSEAGYASRASYGLYQAAIGHFHKSLADNGHVRWLDIGGGAGVASDDDDGLSLFKRGWSNTSRAAYFCGRVLDRDRYEGLLQRKHVSDNGYFPAYRHGEFSSTAALSQSEASVQRKPLPR